MRRTAARPLLGLLALLSALACDRLPGAGGPTSDFARRVADLPEPTWWDRVDAPELATRGQLLEYWRDRERSPEQMFKAAFLMVREYPDEPEIAVPAVSFMVSSDASYPALEELQDAVLDTYFDWDRPLGDYGGKSGDTIAGLARDHAGLLARSGRPAEALALIERLLAAREAEINDQLLQLIALEQARALVDLGRSDEAKSILRHGIDAYAGDWDERLQKELDKLGG